MTPKTTIHKQGYLYKQGTYFSSWNERYFNLETSLLKQFTDSESAIPSYAIYLGSAAVEGIFTAESNDELGYGKMWSFVLRWPLPTSPEIIEEQWGFMHIGSPNEKEIDEWYDSLSALIRVEQTKKVMLAGINVKQALSTPPDFLPIPSGYTRPRLSISEEVRKAIPPKWTNACSKLVEQFNSSPQKWILESSAGGLLHRHRDNERSWKCSIAIPKEKATTKRVWECIMSESAAAWEPGVKGAHAKISDLNVVIENGVQLFTDVWEWTAEGLDAPIRGDQVISSTIERIAWKDEKTGTYLVVGVPKSSTQTLAIEAMAWSVESASDVTVIATVYFTLSKKQPTALIHTISSAYKSEVAQAVVRANLTRVKEFILSQ